jgi:hypothetical protein
VQFANEFYSHRCCSTRQASTDLYKWLYLTCAAPFAVDSHMSQGGITDKIHNENNESAFGLIAIKLECRDRLPSRDSSLQLDPRIVRPPNS